VVVEGPTYKRNDVESNYISIIFWAQCLTQPPGHIPSISHHVRLQGLDERGQKITKNLFEKFLEKR
jgi:hypothetical protein